MILIDLIIFENPYPEILSRVRIISVHAHTRNMATKT